MYQASQMPSNATSNETPMRMKSMRAIPSALMPRISSALTNTGARNFWMLPNPPGSPRKPPSVEAMARMMSGTVIDRGLSWIRAHASDLGIPRETFEKNTLHIHVPAGAIPKDGPSAGITMATAMVSAMTGIPVRKDVAMTGEITLRGRVLPIGGLKSKILAAHLSGARMVIIPQKNEKDLRDIPEEIRKQMKLVLADNMDQVLEHALRRRPQPLKARAAEVTESEAPLAAHPTASGKVRREFPPAEQPPAVASPPRPR